MKIPVVLVLCLSLLQLICGQNSDGNPIDLSFRVVIENGIPLQSEPTEESETLINIPYWSKLNRGNGSSRLDTLEGKKGYWIPVEYEDQKGYVFDCGLIYSNSVLDEKKTYRIMTETIYCGIPNYDPELNWYGIIRTEKGDSIIRVNVSLLPLALIGNAGNEAGKSAITNLWTGQPVNGVILLIGTMQYWEEGICQGPNILEPSFLFPGQVFAPYLDKKPFVGREPTPVLSAIGNVMEAAGYCPDIEGYRIRLSRNRKPYNIQDLTPDFEFWGECHLGPSLSWYGDIDGDDPLDYIFRASSNSETQYTLFLSSEAEGENFVGKVDPFWVGNCY